MMDWLFHRHKPEAAPAVKEAKQERDELFDELDVAMQEVDRLQDTLIADYERADKKRTRGKA